MSDVYAMDEGYLVNINPGDLDVKLTHQDIAAPEFLTKALLDEQWQIIQTRLEECWERIRAIVQLNAIMNGKTRKKKSQQEQNGPEEV